MTKGHHTKRLRKLVLATVLAIVLTSSLFGAPASAAIGILNDPIPLSAAADKVLVPTASGTKAASNSLAVIDYSNASKGYVMVKYSGNVGKIKVLIQKSGGAQYRYDLNLRGTYEVFPLTSGNGTYSIGVYENISGTSYAEALSASVGVELENSFSPYLYPNQYVNFNKNSKVVAKSNELAQNASTDLDIVANVYNYVIGNITYDTQLAATVKSGYLPNVDTLVSSINEARGKKGKGICFDYASLMTAMLRAQGIPTRLEIGLVSGGAKHAWLSTYIKDVGWVNNIIQFDGNSWKMMDPTFASSGGGSSSIMKYIGNGNNYTTQNYY